MCVVGAACWPQTVRDAIPCWSILRSGVTMAQAYDHRRRVEGLELVRTAAVRRLQACLPVVEEEGAHHAARSWLQRAIGALNTSPLLADCVREAWWCVACASPADRAAARVPICSTRSTRAAGPCFVLHKAWLHCVRRCRHGSRRHPATRRTEVPTCFCIRARWTAGRHAGVSSSCSPWPAWRRLSFVLLEGVRCGRSGSHRCHPGVL